ncbi:MAG: VOC family protein [Neptuniibacter sp.]|uniref:VOC family protein n=1 Tax=Neptuniibacter sp. TaxID=1962643 RepID=UPI003B59B667
MESLVLFKLCKLDHVVLICSDITRSLYFYVDVLGCELVRTVKEIPLYQLRAGESLIDLMIRNEDQKSGKNLDHFCLQIMPFEPEQIIKMMNDKGIECGPVEQRYGASGFGRSIYIKDPDGNTIELKEA